MLLPWDTDVASALHNYCDWLMRFFAVQMFGKTKINKIKGSLFAAQCLHSVLKYLRPINSSKNIFYVNYSHEKNALV